MRTETLGTGYFVHRDQAIELLDNGRPLLVPTDTVWGLAVKVDRQSDPDLIFQLKRRDPEKAIPWLVGDLDDLERYCQGLPAWAHALAKRFWPGALTLVCPASDAAPPRFVADDGSLALRMPKQNDTLGLLRQLGAPLATSSANRQGEAPAHDLEDLDASLIAEVGAVLETAAAFSPQYLAAEAAAKDLPSTIVSCLGERPLIVRVGSLAPSLVLGCVGEILG